LRRNRNGAPRQADIAFITSCSMLTVTKQWIRCGWYLFAMQRNNLSGKITGSVRTMNPDTGQDTDQRDGKPWHRLCRNDSQHCRTSSPGDCPAKGQGVSTSRFMMVVRQIW